MNFKESCLATCCMRVVKAICPLAVQHLSRYLCFYHTNKNFQAYFTIKSKNGNTYIDFKTGDDPMLMMPHLPFLVSIIISPSPKQCDVGQ